MARFYRKVFRGLHYSKLHIIVFVYYKPCLNKLKLFNRHTSGYKLAVNADRCFIFVVIHVYVRLMMLAVIFENIFYQLPIETAQFRHFYDLPFIYEAFQRI